VQFVQRVERLYHGIVVGKFMQPAAARAQLSRRLRAAQQEQADDGVLCRIELQLAEGAVAETLRVFLHPALEIVFHAQQVFVLQLAHRVLYRALAK
jgi:hypothetical protein